MFIHRQFRCTHGLKSQANCIVEDRKQPQHTQVLNDVIFVKGENCTYVYEAVYGPSTYSIVHSSSVIHK